MLTFEDGLEFAGSSGESCELAVRVDSAIRSSADDPQ